jgi:hypothetical protein
MKRRKALEKRGLANLLGAWKYSYPFAFQDAYPILEGIICKLKRATLYSLSKHRWSESAVTYSNRSKTMNANVQ